MPPKVNHNEPEVLTLTGAFQIETAQRALYEAGINRRLQIRLGGILSDCEDYIEAANSGDYPPSDKPVGFTWTLAAPDGVQARQDVLKSLEVAAAEEAKPELAMAARSLHELLTAKK